MVLSLVRLVALAALLLGDLVTGFFFLKVSQLSSQHLYTYCEFLKALGDRTQKPRTTGRCVGGVCGRMSYM